MTPFYEELRDIRIAQSLTIEEISKETKIHPRFLHALEEGNFDILPEPYIRLYLKAYALQNGVDYKVVLAKLDEHLHGAAEAEKRNKEQDKFWLLRRPSFSTEAAVGKAKSMGFNRAVFVGAPIVLVAVIILLRTCQDDEGPAGAVEAVPKAAEIMTAQSRDALPERESDPSVAPAERSPLPAFGQGPLQLSMTAHEETWIRITADGDRQYDIILRPGESETWEADEIFHLRLGKSRGVSITLNDRPLKPLGPEDTWVTSALITREGIISSETRPMLVGRD